MDKKSFLIEIGMEELPAEPLLKELKFIEEKWEKILNEFNFKTKFQFFYTPRRFVLWHREINEKQPNRVIERFGAPIKIAYKDGLPTKACESFAKKCNVEISELGEIEKNGKKVLYFSYIEEGQELKNLLPKMVEKWLKLLNFGKSMRWGNGKFEFIRPIHSILTILGQESLKFNIFGVDSSNLTFGHRNSENPKIFISNVGDYFCNLPKQGVIVKQSERELIIKHQFAELEKKHNIAIEIDSTLLAEVVAITENPNSLIGTFDEKFLELPKEVIITSMKTHQRYFPVYNNGKLINKFIVVSNALTNDFSQIIKGNEKVLKARLSDALFFYNNDLKNGLKSDGLEKLLFVKGLGSYLDKVEREKKIASILGKLYNIKDLKELIYTVSISKNDLMSEMVFEFTELQGIMGGYYAEKFGKNISQALKEQYLPSGDLMPTSPFSGVVAISYKLDLLFALFSIGHIPTGSRDPFGLRRAVVGILRIALKFNFKFNLTEIYHLIKDNYQPFEFEKLKSFFFERISNFYNVNSSIIKSVLSVESEILEIDKKIKTLDEVTKGDNFESQLSTFKRVANILKNSNIETDVNIELFQDDSEKLLFNNFQQVKNSTFPNYREKLISLFNLKSDLDNFFDKVMVNVDDEQIKNNRKALLNTIYKEFLTIADIKEISIKLG